VPELVTVPNVPILEVGIDYPAMNGPVSFTREQLVDCVAAANNDPAVRNPRLKLTLVDDTHGTPITEPAFGVVTNMRFDENEQTIYGDYEGVPEWLAEVLPVAYPSRSAEVYRGVKTSTGGSWLAVIGAVQLLGVEWPGCMSLEDLPLWYGKERPKEVVLNLSKGGQVSQVEFMSINVDAVRQAYYEKLEGDGNYSWWCKAILLDPNQLVVEDEWEGDLYLVNFEIDGTEVTFSDPKQVQIKYVPVPKSKTQKLVAANMMASGILESGRKVLCSYATPEEAGRVIQSQEGAEVNEEQRQALALSLGLTEDATEEQISDKLRENAIAALGNGATSTQPPDGGGTTPPAQPTGTASGQPVGGDPMAGTGAPAQGPSTVGHCLSNGATQPQVDDDDTVRLDRAAYDALVSGAESGSRVEARLNEQEDNAFLDAALKAGKFPPARLSHWQTAMKADREGTRQVIDSLAAGMVPVEELGTQPNNFADTGGEAYPAQWLPQVQARKAALAARAKREQEAIENGLPLGSRVFTERPVQGVM
jgi:hypothetical protein